jgi:hypothetical protein
VVSGGLTASKSLHIGKLTAEEEADDGTREASSLGCASEQDSRKEPDVAGKKRPKSLGQTEKKAPATPKRPKKTSRGK